MPAEITAPVDTRRWNAFVCQDCRGIFRVPVGHVGKGVVCPICDRMLRLAVAGESIPALVQSAEDESPQEEIVRLQEMLEPTPQVIDETPSTTPELAVEKVSAIKAQNLPAPERRERKHRSIEDIEQEWQAQPKAVTTSNKRYSMFWLGLGAGTALVAIAFTAFSLLKSNETKPAVPTIPQVTQIPAVLPKPEKAPVVVPQNDLPSIRQLVVDYMNASSLEVLLSHVRQTDDIENKLRNYYEHRNYEAAGFSRLDEDSLMSSEERDVYYAQVFTKSFDPVLLTIVRDQGRFLVDWEATVGWSEMSFSELTKQKPTSPVMVRVIVKSESYYNFDFPPSEERKWQSYRLIFPDESMLHGYVAKASDLDNSLRLSPDEEQKSLILTIKYKPNATSDKQVLIESIVHDRWLAPK